MSNTTTTIIVLLLIAVGGFLVFGGGQSQPTDSQPVTTTPNNTPTTSTSTPADTNATSTNDQANQQAGQPAAATVTYENGQFAPQKVTIQQGQTVRFVSKSGSMWVGSDRHPTHTQYDGTTLREHCQGSASSFDQCETGQSYSFTFEKTGSFSYHNHVNPTAGGTVIVQ